MEKVFGSLIWGAVHPDVSAVARAILDFIYYASYPSHSTETLWRLQDALDTFHKYKKVFIRYGIRKHFRIPKLHMLEHYVMLIRLKGAADGFSTELSERLHIDCAKESYRASNKKNYTDQMVRYLTHHEAIHSFTSFLLWTNAIQEPAEPGDQGVDQGDDDDEEEAVGEEAVTAADGGQDSAEPAEEPEQDTIAVRALTGLAWHVPKKPSFPNRSVQQLIMAHGATDIVHAVSQYLKDHAPHSRITPTEYDHFDVYKRITADLPSVQRLTDNTIRDVIRATPAVKAKGRIKAEPAHFDCVLVHHTNEAEDIGLNG